MRAIDYALRQAIASLWRSRAASAFAIVAIALALTVFGALTLVTWNAQRLLDRWSAAAEISVYLQDGATSEQRGAIEDVLDDSVAVAGHEYVSKTQALARFRREFSEFAALTAEMPDNPFPASLEVQIRPDAERDGRAAALAQRLIGLPGVADVRYDREWLARLTSAVQAVQLTGWGLGLLMGAAAALTVAAVVRLGLHARRDELEIMELVGAPVAFIRGPFVAEGLLQGGAGALVALVVLWILWSVGRSWWATDVAGLLAAGGAFDFLPIRWSILLVGGGMAVGSLGGFAASRHAG